MQPSDPCGGAACRPPQAGCASACRDIRREQRHQEKRLTLLSDLRDRVKVSVGGAKQNRIACNRRGRQNRSYRKHLLNSAYHVVVERIRESGFIIWRALRIRKGRAVLPCGFGLKRPGKFLRSEIDRQ